MRTSSRFLVFAILVCLLQFVWAGDRPGRAAVASAHQQATAAGERILRQGGNAFDAAVAVSAALAVVEPESSGIGGGGFWLLHRAEGGHSIMIDGRETAPAAAKPDMYIDADGEVDRNLATNGPLAAGIPGAPAAWVHLAEHYGSLPLAELLAPAVELAEKGFAVDAKYLSRINYRAHVMLRWPETAAIFMPDGEVPEIGDVIRQPDLGATLRILAREGADGFYGGDLAERMVTGVRDAGGIWTLADLADYRVVEREPIRSTYRGYELITASPPSSGGVAIAQILNIIEPFDLDGMDRLTRVHLLTEAMRRAYRDRALYLGDPDFVDMPVQMLLSPAYAAGQRTSLRLDRATPSASLAAGADRIAIESDNTSHFSLMDAEGNLVSATMSVNFGFGAAFAPPGTGVLLNNEMDDFSAAPAEPNAWGLIGFSANAIEPGKRMLSSMAPTIVRSDDRLAILGAMGGSRIISMLVISILDFVEGNGAQSWVDQPRFHHQYVPDEISIERDALTGQQIKALESLGHKVSTRALHWGNMHGVMWDRANGTIEAAHDPRWESGGAVVIELN